MTTISANGVSASTLRLLGEEVLVRPHALERERPSGLVIPHSPTQNFLGDVFYGTVVAVGPGRLITKGPKAGRYEPLPWAPGDEVVCRQGFGPEIMLLEGPHHVIGRGNAQYGHGIVAAWTPEHVHCWHVMGLDNYEHGERVGDGEAACSCCSCHEIKVIPSALPTCSDRAPRVLESVLGVTVQATTIPDAPGHVYEERPEE